MSAQRELLRGDVHPNWCELGADCAPDSHDPRHVGLTSTTYPDRDDVRVEVQLVRQDDRTPSGETMWSGRTEIVMRLTNTACLTGHGEPMTADVHLSSADARSLAHTLTTYASRAAGVHMSFQREMVASDS